MQIRTNISFCFTFTVFIILVGIVVFSFVVSLTFVQQSGNYWLDVFDTFAGSVPLLIIAFFELIAVAWIYKYRR